MSYTLPREGWPAPDRGTGRAAGRPIWGLRGLESGCPHSWGSLEHMSWQASSHSATGIFMICKYLFLLIDLHFHYLSGVFWWTEVLSSNKVIIYCSFPLCLGLFVLYLRKFFSCPRPRNYSFMLSFQSFVTLLYTFRSTIHLIWLLYLPWGKVETHFLKGEYPIDSADFMKDHPFCLTVWQCFFLSQIK